MQIEVKNVSFCYIKKQKVLENVNLSVDKGEFIGLMGQTGSGKTSLISLIAGLKKPTEGKIFIDGEDINSSSYNKITLRKKLGIVFQYPEYQLFETTVKKDVGFTLKQLYGREDEEKIKKALTLMGFDYEKIKNVSPFSLSGGEKRRAAAAGVIVNEPEILIFDEPLSGLDPVGRREFLSLIKKLNSGGTTVIMISHCTEDIAENCSRVIVMKDGKKAFDGASSVLFSDEEKALNLHLDLPDAKKTADILYEKGFIKNNRIYLKNELIDSIVSAVKGGDSP